MIVRTSRAKVGHCQAPIKPNAQSLDWAFGLDEGGSHVHEVLRPKGWVYRYRGERLGAVCYHSRESLFGGNSGHQKFNDRLPMPANGRR